jgi:hypothetical protein
VGERWKHQFIRSPYRGWDKGTSLHPLATLGPFYCPIDVFGVFRKSLPTVFIAALERTSLAHPMYLLDPAPIPYKGYE